MACYLCGSNEALEVRGTVRDRPEIGIRKCVSCGLVFLDDFSHVHDAFYEDDYNAENHPGQNWRQHLEDCRVDDERRLSQILPRIASRRYLDVGCGGGGVLVRAREHCSAVCGIEPQSRWRTQLAELGLDVRATLDDVPAAHFDVVTAFHVLEHVPDPLAFLAQLTAKLVPGGTLWIEVPSADDALLTLYECDAFSRFTYWSPHLFLFSPNTLRMLLRRAKLDADGLIQQFQRYPLSNHLHWLAKAKPGGHVAWASLDTPALTEAYASALAALGRCDTLIAIVQKPAS